MAASNEESGAMIGGRIQRQSDVLEKILRKVERAEKFDLEHVESLIFIFFLISETVGRSCSVYLTQMANYVGDPTVVMRLKLFQPSDTTKKSGIGKFAPKYRLNFIVLRELLKSKGILSEKSGEGKLSSLKEQRKDLVRYITNDMEDPNFLRGYAIIRYIESNDQIMLTIFKTVLQKTFVNGKKFFTEKEIEPYFSQQVIGGKNDIADCLGDRDLKAELTTQAGLVLIDTCCNNFNKLWDAVLAKL